MSEKKKEAEDNLRYGTKKYFKKNLEEYGDIVKSGLDKGLDSLKQMDIDIMSDDYKKMVEAGASDLDKKEAKSKMRAIVKEYVENKKIEAEGKNVFDEKRKRYKDI